MKEKISNLTSGTISALRFPLTVGVVFIHFNVLSDDMVLQGAGNADRFPAWFAYMVRLCSVVLPSIAVPLFFIISGYLFFRSDFTMRNYADKLRRRTHTLLIPYILWNLIGLMMKSVQTVPAFSGLFVHPDSGNWSLSAVLACFWDRSFGVFPPTAHSTVITPEDYPLWYVRDLMVMVMVMLAPAFYWMLKKAGWRAVVALGMVWYARPFIDDITYFGQFITAAFFFAWGACYGLKGMDMAASMSRAKRIALLYPLWAVADILKLEGTCGGLIHNAGIIFGIFAAVALAKHLLERGVIRVHKFLSDGSFFVYALHALIIVVLARCVTKVFFVDSLLYTVALYFAVPCLTVGVSLALYALLRRFAPRVWAALTGGR